MDRKEFIKVCGGSCLALIGLSLLNSGCSGTHYVQSTAANNQLTIPKNEFIEIKKNKFRNYIVVKATQLDFPIAVFKSENKYQAILMRCTHQGNELSINGDILTCSAHGSEFNSKGEIIQGPADQQLKTFPVSEDETNIYLQLI